MSMFALHQRTCTKCDQAVEFEHGQICACGALLFCDECFPGLSDDEKFCPRCS